jgi:hypothetical protein
MNFATAQRLKTLVVSGLVASTFTGALTQPAAAFTKQDADTAIDSYLRAFLIPVQNGSFLKGRQIGGGDPGFWQQLESIEGIEDANDRTGGAYNTEVSTLLYGFVGVHGDLWSNNIFNDDIAWGVIAYMRAHKTLGDPNFLTIAKRNFDMMYARAWNPKEGALWWTTDNTSFNACIECPAGIAAFLLGEALNDPSYTEKARTLFDWTKANLYDAETGAVWDNIDTKGKISKWSSTYNQGTFVGLANYLGDVKNAQLALDYIRENATHTTYRVKGHLILPGYDYRGRNNAGLTSIGLRWFAKFMKDRQMEDRYVEWLQANANAAWDVRRSDNLSWPMWDKLTPSYDMFSWDAVNAMVALQVTPPDEVIIQGITFRHAYRRNEHIPAR